MSGRCSTADWWPRTSCSWPLDHGLGTIVQAQAVHYPNVLRQMLGIPDSKLVLVGIAIGYPDWDNPINQFRSDREAVDSVVKWYGFD